MRKKRTKTKRLFQKFVFLASIISANKIGNVFIVPWALHFLNLISFFIYSQMIHIDVLSNLFCLKQENGNKIICHVGVLEWLVYLWSWHTITLVLPEQRNIKQIPTYVCYFIYILHQIFGHFIFKASVAIKQCLSMLIPTYLCTS